MTPQEVGQFNDDVYQFVRTLWLVLATSVGLGAVTMVVLQLVKDLSPVRRLWQQQHIRKWLGTQSHFAAIYEYQQISEFQREGNVDWKPEWDLFREQPNPWKAEKDLILLGCAGRKEALYSLPVEQLAGQLSAAMQLVVDYPAGHIDLLRLLGTGASLADLQIVISPSGVDQPSDSKVGEVDTRTKLNNLVDARTRLSHVVQRNLDAFQISIAFRWKLYLQLFAVALGIVLMILLVRIFPPNRGTLEYIQAVVIGILGGFLSSTLWDLFGAIRNRRGNN